MPATPATARKLKTLAALVSAKCTAYTHTDGSEGVRVSVGASTMVDKLATARPTAAVTRTDAGWVAQLDGLRLLVVKLPSDSCAVLLAR